MAQADSAGEVSSSSERRLVQDEIQRSALSTMFYNGQPRSGSLFMGTGTGKTKVAIDYIKTFTKNNGKPPKVLWGVPTVKLRDEDHPKEFIKWDATNEMLNTDFVCYSSLGKVKDRSYDICVLDECQNITENNYQFVSNNTIDNYLCMTATEPEDEVKKDLIQSIAPERFTYSLEEGVEDAVVKPINIWVVRVPLEAEEKTVEIKTKEFHFKTTEAKNYAYLSMMADKFKKLYFRSKSDGTKNVWFKWLGKRSNFLYTLKSKEIVAKQILEALGDLRVLVFSKRIAMIDALNIPTYHSNKGDEDLQKFYKELVTKLGVVDALNEGANVPNLRIALVVNLDSKKKNLIQRVGRCVRMGETDEEAYIIILLSPGTQDAEWFKSAISIFKDTNIKYFDKDSIITHLISLQDV